MLGFGIFLYIVGLLIMALVIAFPGSVAWAKDAWFFWWGLFALLTIFGVLIVLILGDIPRANAGITLGAIAGGAVLVHLWIRISELNPSDHCCYGESSQCCR